MTLYVGNISFNMTENNLKDAFAAYGEVNSVKIIKDKLTGKSKGFAFVEMENDSEGEAAVNALNGMEIMGRNLKVNQAHPREAKV